MNKSMIKSLGNMYLNDNPLCAIKITDYFVKRFLKQNDIKYKTLHEELKSSSKENVHDFFEYYNMIVKDYADKDVFNMDETGLFIRNIGNKSFTLSRTDNKNVKIDKTRITVGLTISRLNEQLPPLVIGKSANPRCFKGHNIN